MLPSVASLKSFDVYRDGGSMSATFLDQDGLTQELLFPVDQASRNSPLGLDYSSPELVTFRCNTYTSPVTGTSYPDWQNSSASLSWHEAQHILEALAPLAADFATIYPEVFPSMLRIAASKNQAASGA
jgi:hypothetical protein